MFTDRFFFLGGISTLLHRYEGKLDTDETLLSSSIDLIPTSRPPRNTLLVL